jgi:hypothetical protein
MTPSRLRAARKGLRAGVLLVRRYVETVRARPLDPVEAAWVAAQLSPAERDLFGRMSVADQRHALGVARRAAAAGLRGEAVVAALFHDVGKVDAGLGPLGRVIGTVGRLVLGRARVVRLTGRIRVLAPIGWYVDHAARGEQRLREIGANDLVATWAGDHHRHPLHYRVPLETGVVLARADGD